MSYLPGPEGGATTKDTRSALVRSSSF